MGGRIRENYTNPCLTMHQPWASLLVHGIKRIEGRSWPAPTRGCLWIHAASKIPDPATIKAMEHFYREIYAVNGITDLKFPEHYPVSRLLGCVEVIGCIKCEELVGWEEVPEGVRLEGQTDFCWLCEQPQRLLIPFEMRGYQRVYNLEKKIFEAAVRGLRPVEGPLPVKFPLPDPSDKFSLKPGSLVSYIPGSKASEVEKTSSLTAAIAGARAAATQFSKKEQAKNYQTYFSQGKDDGLTAAIAGAQAAATKFSKMEQAKSYQSNLSQGRDVDHHTEASHSNNNKMVEVEEDEDELQSIDNTVERINHWDQGGNSRGRGGLTRNSNQQPGAPHKIFAAAMKGVRPA